MGIIKPYLLSEYRGKNYDRDHAISIPQWLGWAKAAQKKLEEQPDRTNGERLAA